LQGTDIKLFRFNDEGGAGAWELHAPAVAPHFFNANEDAAAAATKWCLEVDEAEAEVTDQFSLEPGGRRVIFRGGTTIWALLFPSDATFRAFVELYNNHLFANTYGVENDEDNRAKAGPSSKYACDANSVPMFILPQRGVKGTLDAHSPL